MADHNRQDHWSVAGLEVPLPPGRADDRVEGPRGGRYERYFRCGALTLEHAAEVWKRWGQAQVGWRMLDNRGPGEMGMAQVWEGPGRSLTINAVGMPGKPRQVSILVVAEAEGPNAVMHDGNVMLSAEVAVPLPAGAIAGKRQDLSDFGGEDTHQFEVGDWTVAAVERFYLSWAVGAGMQLIDRVDGQGSVALFLSDGAALKLNIYFDEPRGGDARGSLRVALGSEELDGDFE